MSRDTSHDAEAAQCEAHRRMGGKARLEMAIDLSLMTRRAAAQGVRNQRPSATDREVSDAVMRMTLGGDLFAKVVAHRDSLRGRADAVNRP